jgi:hypothetical protein
LGLDTIIIVNNIIAITFSLQPNMQSAQQNASWQLIKELFIEYPKRWHKFAAAAADDDDKSKL